MITKDTDFHRVAVDSSLIKSAGYLPYAPRLKTGIVEVEFNKDGGVYRYLEVPESEYRDMMKAKSVGKYFSACIRDIYSFEKVVR